MRVLCHCACALCLVSVLHPSFIVLMRVLRSSWRGLMEHLAAASDAASAEQKPAQPPGQQRDDQDNAQPAGSAAQDNAQPAGSAAGGGGSLDAGGSGSGGSGTVTDVAAVQAWLWSMARAVQHGKCELGSEEQGFAQSVARLRLARLRHD